jgi:nodulation protein E
VSALGLSTRQFRDALRQGKPGIGPLTGLPTEHLKVRIGAQVPAYRPQDCFAAADLPLLDRFSQFALLAAREAVADSGLEPTALRAAAAVIGTGCGGKGTDEETYQRLYREARPRVHPLTIPKGMPSAAVSQLSMQLGITGPVFSVASACASAAHAVGLALILIRSGVVDVALAGGTDAPFTFGLMKAWEALRVLSTDTCRPFSKDRSGLVLGEGAAVVVLESRESARRRGAVLHAELAGCGMSADAAHITDPSVAGAARAMRAALADAALLPADVDYVNAHGTGTLANDVSETRALHQVFGDHAARLAVSSTKSMHGHSLGAAGAHELIATVLALEEGMMPPTANFTEAGEGCDLDYVPNEARQGRLRVALSNSFAFGGLNAVLALRAADR